jgi:hypothetical protein
MRPLRSWQVWLDAGATVFLLQGALVGQFDDFVMLAEEDFPDGRIDGIELVCDPENPVDEWVTLHMTVDSGDDDDRYQRYREFVGRTVERIPARAEGLFRFNLHVADEG